jgi:outer membrane immunogenic protein
MKLSLIAVALCALSLPAFAGGPTEAPVEATPVGVAPAPQFDWTGFYAGVGLLRGSFTFGADNDTDGFSLQAGYLRDFGQFVLGGELAYASGDYSVYLNNEWDATRLKLSAGYDAGQVLPYVFVGLSRYNVTGGSEFSDTVTIYGLGGRFAVTPRTMLGLEYLVEDKDDFGGVDADLENSELTLRVDYRF